VIRSSCAVHTSQVLHLGRVCARELLNHFPLPTLGAVQERRDF
jgi:hypothetical protein